MNTFRQPAIAMVFFMVFVGLFVTIYGEFQDAYDFETDSNMIVDGQNFEIAMERLVLSSRLENISKNIVKISAPSNPLDVLGSLAAAGLGVGQLAYDIATYPVLILDVIDNYYKDIIPLPIVELIRVLFIVSLAFILLSIIVKRDV